MVSEWSAWRWRCDEHGHGVCSEGEASTRKHQRQTPPPSPPPLPSRLAGNGPRIGPHDLLRVRARSHPVAVRPCTATRPRVARACPWGRWRTPRTTRRASSWRVAPPECPMRARLERGMRSRWHHGHSWRTERLGRPSRDNACRAAHSTTWTRPRLPGCRAAALPRGHFQQA